MPIINLKIMYSDYYNEDFMLEVSEQIAHALIQSFRDEAAYQRTRRNNRVTIFFDSCDEEYIAARSSVYPTLEELFDKQLDKQRLHKALNQLSVTQARRIYKHYILGMSKRDIARAEGVHESSVKDSIYAGEKNLRKILKFL